MASELLPELPYFVSEVVFGKRGVSRPLSPIGELNDYEKSRLTEASIQLKGDIQLGVEYANAYAIWIEKQGPKGEATWPPAVALAQRLQNQEKVPNEDC